jgi:hypothetical protein
VESPERLGVGRENRVGHVALPFPVSR